MYGKEQCCEKRDPRFTRQFPYQQENQHGVEYVQDHVCDVCEREAFSPECVFCFIRKECHGNVELRVVRRKYPFDALLTHLRHKRVVEVERRVIHHQSSCLWSMHVDEDSKDCDEQRLEQEQTSIT